MSNRSLDQALQHRRDAWLACIGLVAVTWCWLEGRGLRSAEGAFLATYESTRQMADDAARIESLRDTPRLAIERVRPNDELLSQIRGAMSAAAIPADRWVGNDPHSPTRVSRSPYKRLGVRLSFDEVTLRQLLQFAHHLIQADPALAVPWVRLAAPSENSSQEKWNVELTVSYLVYSP